MMREDAIVDVTVTAAPPSTKNKDGERTRKASIEVRQC